MSNIKINNNPSYDIMPELSIDEKQALEQAIVEAGEVLVPIEIDEHGNILDGRARVEIAERLGISYHAVVRSGLTEERKRQHIISLNVARRQLSRENFNQYILLLRKSGMSCQAIAEVSKSSKSTIHRILADAPDEFTPPDNIIGKNGKRYPVHPTRPSVYAPTPRETQKALNLMSAINPDELPDRQINVRDLSKLVGRIEKERHDAEILKQNSFRDYNGISNLDTVECCDIQDLALPSDSIDMIFTDPPYDADSVILYEILAELAARVLKPGAYCIAYTGNWHLPRVIKAMGQHLEYVWTYGEFHPQSRTRVYQKKVIGKQRLLLVFKKPGETQRHEWVEDAIWCDKEKTLHDWQQAEAAPRLYIPAYTCPGDVVLDPFVGGGTTPAVCKALGRHFLTYDTDPVAIATTIDRLKTISCDESNTEGGDW